MSNDISIVKNVIDIPQHKVSVPNDILLNQKQKDIGIAKNQEKFWIVSSKISDFKNLKINLLDSNSSSKEESESEEKITKGDGHSNVI
ncbi:MAG TPA: hypothetical protein VLA74_10960 [Nitrososphaeraceae archaeon]|nr:hypothetical protein [Nitrososphaeraceae archaeon]